MNVIKWKGMFSASTNRHVCASTDNVTNAAVISVRLVNAELAIIATVVSAHDTHPSGPKPR